MKTDILNAPNGVNIDPAINLDNFIVSETLAKEGLVSSTSKSTVKTIFTPADLWNIRKRSKMAGFRKNR